MKQILLFVVLAIFYTSAIGQLKLNYNNKQYTISQTSIVKDSAGQSYVYKDWLNMLTSGGYDIKPSDPGNNQTSFLLVRISKEEQQRRLAQSPKPPESNAFKSNKKISAFKVQDMSGAEFDSKELKGKIVVLNFWFINCLPCQMERPYLNELVKEYAANDNIVFLAIALDNKPALDSFLKKNPFDYHVIPDGRAIANENKVEGYPTHVILNKEGKIVFSTVSYNAITGYWMRKTIEEIKNGQ
jgi:thiol-disulfide isomerase/thioredoxin